MRTKSVPLPFWYANPGHLGPAQPDYARRQDVGQWGRGICYIEAKVGDPAKMAGREWNAEVVSLDESRRGHDTSKQSQVHPLYKEASEKFRGLASQVANSKRRSRRVS